jgi:hypothetical protein
MPKGVCSAFNSSSGQRSRELNSMVSSDIKCNTARHLYRSAQKSQLSQIRKSLIEFSPMLLVGQDASLRIEALFWRMHGHCIRKSSRCYADTTSLRSLQDFATPFDLKFVFSVPNQKTDAKKLFLWTSHKIKRIVIMRMFWNVPRKSRCLKEPCVTDTGTGAKQWGRSNGDGKSYLIRWKSRGSCIWNDRDGRCSSINLTWHRSFRLKPSSGSSSQATESLTSINLRSTLPCFIDYFPWIAR